MYGQQRRCFVLINGPIRKLEMRLYHSRHIEYKTLLWVFGICVAGILTGCAAPQATQALTSVTIYADGQEIPIQIPAGSSVQQALEAAGLSLGPLDRIDLPLYTILTNGVDVHVVRVTEDFEVVQEVIPFGHQTLRNESLALNQEILLQSGKNGLREITYRRTYEDGVEVSSSQTPVKSLTLEEPVPEILMIGIQTPLYPIDVPGHLVYLRDGNAWMIEDTSANRRAVVTTGDLDGRVFSLSSDGSWLLFTRRAEETGQINSLWAVDLTAQPGDASASQLIDLKVANVVHFADWVPGSNTKVVFSTVEPRSAAPGWQANNDLNALSFSSSGWTTKWAAVLEPNSGGIYGWWGLSFEWAPDGRQLVFTRPDSIGLLDYLEGTQATITEVIPLQTRADWAWVPGVSWGPDGKTLFMVDHVTPPGFASPEESPSFALAALSLDTGVQVQLVPEAGMFAYPLASPLQPQATGEMAYQVAFLQADYPNQSESSYYHLVTMDRDGSDRRILFPADGSMSLRPQREWGAWSAEPMPETGNYAIAVLYQGNLWLVDTASEAKAGQRAWQITGDGLTSRVAWK